MTTSSWMRWGGLALCAFSCCVLAAAGESTEGWPRYALDLDAPDAGELVSGDSTVIDDEWTSTIADLDGNGRADLIIALPLAGEGDRGEAGVVYVLFDAASRTPGHLDLDSLSRHQGIRVVGARAGDRLGWSLDTVGDFDGDGIDDLIVGAPGGAEGGGAWLVRGRPRAQWPGEAVLDLEHDASAGGLRFVADAGARSLGLAVAGLGDINGDGLADLAVSDPRAAREGRPGAGAVHVVFGGQDYPQSVPLSAASPVHGFSLRGERRGDYLGGAVTAVNGPAGKGLAVGVPGRQRGRGGVMIIDFLPSMAGRSLDNEHDEPDGMNWIHGPVDGGRFGASLAGGFDFDGDASDDLVIGAPRHRDGIHGGAGAVFVVAGGSREISAHFAGSRGAPGLGSALYPAGDLNRDGRADLLIDSQARTGRWLSEAPTPESGTLVLFGGAGMSGWHTSPPAGMRLTAGPVAEGSAGLAELDGRQWRMRSAGVTAARQAPLLLVGPSPESRGLDRSARLHLLRPRGTGPLINDGTGIPDHSVVSGDFLSIDFTVSDPVDPPESLVLEVESGNPNLLPNELFELSGTAGNRTLSIETPTGVSGSVTVTVRVFNSQGLFSEAPFQLEILPAGTPLINDGTGIPDQSVVSGGFLSIDFTVSDPVDPPESLTLEVESGDPGLLPNELFALSGTTGNRTLSIQAPTGVTGSVIVTVRVFNSQGQFSEAPFQLEILPGGTPLINDGTGIPDQSVVSGGLLSIDFTVSDPVDPPESLVLEVESGDPGLLPNELFDLSGTTGNRTLSIEAPTGVSGSVIVTVRVFNSQGLFSEAPFQLDILPAGAPQINGGGGIGDQTVYEGQALNIGFTVEDPTAPASDLVVEAASLAPTVVPPHALVLGGADTMRTLQIQTQVGATGTAGIVVTVVNPLGDSADAAFDLQVLQRPPPQINNGAGLPQQSVIAGEALAMAFSVSDLIDPPGAVGVQAASLAPDLVAQSDVAVGGTGATRILSVQTQPEQTGVATIRIQATNSVGYVGSANLTLRIEEEPAPEINDGEPIEPLSVPEGERPSVPFTVADPNDPPHALLLRAFSSNQDVLPDEALELIGDGLERVLEIDTSLGSPGTTLITIEVTNSLGLVRTRSFELTIEHAPTELAVDVEPIDAPPQMGRFFRVDIANTGAEAAIEPGVIGTVAGEFSLLGAYALAPECMIVDSGVYCDPDAISAWQCGATDQEASCSLNSLPPGGVAPLVLQVSREGAGILAVDVIADNAPLQTLEIELPAASGAQP